MPPTSTAGSAERRDAAAGPAGGGGARPRAGFVLLEIVPALIILGLALVLALPWIPRGTGPTALTALAVEAAALVRSARSDALAVGAEAFAVVDRRRRRLEAGERSVAVPRDVDLTVLAGDGCRTEPDRVAILFRADGTSCGGVIRFAKGPRAFRVRVNWATGNVAIVEGG